MAPLFVFGTRNPLGWRVCWNARSRDSANDEAKVACSPAKMNESSFLGEISDLRDEARRIDILIIPSLFTLVSLVSSRFFFLPFLLVRLQIRKIKILSRYTLPFNLLPDRITLHLLEHVVTTLRSVHARPVMYVSDTHAREHTQAGKSTMLSKRYKQSGRKIEWIQFLS